MFSKLNPKGRCANSKPNSFLENFPFRILWLNSESFIEILGKRGIQSWQISKTQKEKERFILILKHILLLNLRKYFEVISCNKVKIMWIWSEMLLHTGGTNYLASMMKSFQIWRNMEGCFPLSWNKDSFCKLICQSFIAEFKIYCWKNIFCEKLATFMRHLLRLRRITSGYLFPDLLNRRLNISEIKGLMECRHICFFLMFFL